MGRLPKKDDSYVCCSQCFVDPGLRYLTDQSGIVDPTTCARCEATGARKLTRDVLADVAHRFYVRGSFVRCEYGGAPVLEINDSNDGDKFDGAMGLDVKLLRDITDMRVFHYGPNLWMLGHIEPLDDLRNVSSRPSVIARILNEYPSSVLGKGSELFRLRVNPEKPEDEKEYDSPPAKILGQGRFCRNGKPVFYASQDLETCIHEVRATVEDRLYVATLRCASELKFLDLTAPLIEAVTDFESLDLAVLFTFLAGKHAYSITRKIADAAEAAGFDGIIFPSYFSRLRSGTETVATVYGMSARRLKQLREHENSKVVRNLVIFGRPLKRGKLTVSGINSVMLERVEYRVNLGPVGF